MSIIAIIIVVVAVAAVVVTTNEDVSAIEAFPSSCELLSCAHLVALRVNLRAKQNNSVPSRTSRPAPNDGPEPSSDGE